MGFHRTICNSHRQTMSNVPAQEAHKQCSNANHQLLVALASAYSKETLEKPGTLSNKVPKFLPKTCQHTISAGASILTDMGRTSCLLLCTPRCDDACRSWIDPFLSEFGCWCNCSCCWSRIRTGCQLVEECSGVEYFSSLYGHNMFSSGGTDDDRALSLQRLTSTYSAIHVLGCYCSRGNLCTVQLLVQLQYSTLGLLFLVKCDTSVVMQHCTKTDGIRHFYETSEVLT